MCTLWWFKDEEAGDEAPVGKRAASDATASDTAVLVPQLSTELQHQGTKGTSLHRRVVGREYQTAHRGQSKLPNHFEAVERMDPWEIRAYDGSSCVDSSLSGLQESGRDSEGTQTPMERLAPPGRQGDQGQRGIGPCLDGFYRAGRNRRYRAPDTFRRRREPSRHHRIFEGYSRRDPLPGPGGDQRFGAGDYMGCTGGMAWNPAPGLRDTHVAADRRLCGLQVGSTTTTAATENVEGIPGKHTHSSPPERMVQSRDPSDPPEDQNYQANPYHISSAPAPRPDLVIQPIFSNSRGTLETIPESQHSRALTQGARAGAVSSKPPAVIDHPFRPSRDAEDQQPHRELDETAEPPVKDDRRIWRSKDREGVSESLEHLSSIQAVHRLPGSSSAQEWEGPSGMRGGGFNRFGLA